MIKRLSKALADAGVASRRKCDVLIDEGRVRVNGKIIFEPFFRVETEKDFIEVDGQRIKSEERKVYFVLNKPPGYLCSAERDHPQRRLVLDLFGRMPFRLFTVGRLDKETTGLIIATNDGEFANRVIHPSFGLHKEYIAKTDQEIMEEHLKKIASGMWMDHEFVKPVVVKKVRRGTVKIIVADGKKHEVRRLLEHAGLEVKELCRVRIGSLTLGGLPLGHFRELSKAEISDLSKGSPKKSARAA